MVRVEVERQTYSILAPMLKIVTHVDLSYCVLLMEQSHG
jgi:hypothetical protein